MKELYSNADDCYELTKMLRNKLNNKMHFIVAPYTEVVEGKYQCLDIKNYKDYDEYMKDKVLFNYKYLKNGFLRITVGEENEELSLGHKLAVLSEFYKALKEEFGEPTLFYTIKEDNESTLNLQWSFDNKKEDIKEFKNNKAFNDANVEKVILIDSYKNHNNNIGLPYELSFLIKEDIDNYIKYKKGYLKLDKENEKINIKKKMLKI